MRTPEGVRLNLRDVYRVCLEESAAIFLLDAEEVAKLRAHPAKHIARAATREITGASFPAIGRAIGVDHTTVMMSLDKAKQSECARVVAAVRARLVDSKAAAIREQDAEDRVAALEERVSHLERLLFRRRSAA